MFQENFVYAQSVYTRKYDIKIFLSYSYGICKPNNDVVSMSLLNLSILEKNILSAIFTEKNSLSPMNNCQFINSFVLEAEITLNQWCLFFLFPTV